MRTPLLIINMKNYLEASGGKAVKLAQTAETVARELGVEVAVSPPPSYLGLVAEAVAIPVLAQHIDPAEPGSTTGAVVPEMVKALGAVGALVNHSERRISFNVLEQTVTRMEEVGLTQVVCAQTLGEVSRIAVLNPRFIAIEPPDLIGSGVAVSKTRPEVVTTSVEAARRVNPTVKVICGAGIVTGEDVKAALNLGSTGVLVASGIVKAPDWRSKIMELATPLKT